MLHRTMTVMGVVAVLACTAVLHANETSDIVERFTFTAVDAPPDALAKDGRLHLVLKRWSTDDERQLMEQAVAEPMRLLEPFRNTGGIGYLQWPGGLEYTVRYARRTERPDGGADMVFVAERPVWVWWDATRPWSNERPFTVIHVRVDKDGAGDGRVSTDVRSDKDAGVTLEDLNQQPLLTGVRRESVS